MISLFVFHLLIILAALAYVGGQPTWLRLSLLLLEPISICFITFLLLKGNVEKRRVEKILFRFHAVILFVAIFIFIIDVVFLGSANRGFAPPRPDHDQGQESKSKN